ncbi:MAG: PEP-CTERM sorting domain-containing protein [Chthoniobacteraceae bacterium]
MKTPKTRHPRYSSAALVALTLAGAFSGTAQAATSTWTGTTGLWSTSTNWDSAPVVSGSITLGNVTTGTRTVTYDNTATTGTIATLTLTQTSVALNQLFVTGTKGLTISNAITLGATSGTTELRIGDSSTTNNTGYTYLTASSGVTINSGGVLNFQVGGSSSGGSPTLVGNVTISGGLLGILVGGNHYSSNAGLITGNVSMTSGTIRLADPSDSYSRGRLNLTGSFTATGGTIIGGNNTLNEIYAGGNITIGSGVTLTSTPSFCLSANGSVLTLDATGAGILQARTWISSGTSTVTFKTSGTAALQATGIGFGVSTPNVRQKIVLGSNLTKTGTSVTPIQANYGAGSGNNSEYEVDLAGHTFDATAYLAAWAPNTAGGTAKYYITSSTAGGVFKLQQINLSTASTQTTIGAGVTVQLSGGNGATINLSGSNTFAATSTVLYIGTATTGFAAVLTTNSALGNLTIKNGAVKVSGSALTTAGALTVDAGGTLDVSAYAANASGGLVLGSATGSGLITGAQGIVLAGTNGGAVAASLISGTINSAISSGTATSTVTKTGTSTTVVLNGVNTYLGATTVSEGRLDINGSLGASSAVGIATSGTLGGSGTINGTVVNSGVITGGLTFANDVTINSGATANATAFNSNIVDNGSITGGLTVQGGKVLSGSGSVSGTTAVNGGTVNGTGLTLGATLLYGSSTLSGYNVASSMTITGGTTSLTGTTHSTATLSVSTGAILNNNGTVDGNVGVSGLIKGTGTVTGNLALTSGTLSPGNSPGITTVQGNFTMDASSKLVAEVTGTAAGSAYDQVKVSGNVILAGTLDLSTLTGLSLGDTIILIDNTGSSTTSGYFSQIITSGSTYTIGAAGGTYTFTSGTAEYLINYAANADGDSVNNDVTLTVVPEPGTWAMLMGGMGLLTLGQRLRRRSAR